MNVNLDTQDRARHLPAGRKARLAAYVAEAGQVTVGALAERFGVSIDTIRSTAGPSASRRYPESTGR